jgi:hypothetical protein
VVSRIGLRERCLSPAAVVSPTRALSLPKADWRAGVEPSLEVSHAKIARIHMISKSGHNLTSECYRYEERQTVVREGRKRQKYTTAGIRS